MRSHMRRTLVMAAPQPLAPCCFRGLNKLNNCAGSIPAPPQGCGRGEPLLRRGNPIFHCGRWPKPSGGDGFFREFGHVAAAGGRIGGFASCGAGARKGSRRGGASENGPQTVSHDPRDDPGIRPKSTAGWPMGACRTRRNPPIFGPNLPKRGAGRGAILGRGPDGAGFATHKIRRDPKSMRHANGQFRPP
jgi:hypothetical protein